MTRFNESRRTEKEVDEFFCPQCNSLSLNIEEQYGTCTKSECEYEGNVKKCESDGCLNVVTYDKGIEYCTECIEDRKGK